MTSSFLMYNFTARWQKRILHNAPDALSRYPNADPTPTDEIVEHSALYPCQVAGLQQRNDLSVKLHNVMEAAELNYDYQQLKSLITAGFPHAKAILPECMKPFWHVRHNLTIDNDFIVFGCRLLILIVLRSCILRNLHESHQGITRTKERARLAVYWPSID